MNRDRFQMVGNIKRVTGGPGGEAFLVIGDEKSAVIDCGMAFCGTQLVENIKTELPEGRSLDYILLTHTHYDHIGGLPYLKQAWPSSIAVGSRLAKSTLQRCDVLCNIRRLSSDIEECFKVSAEEWGLDWKYKGVVIDYNDDDMKIDQIVREEDNISLGNKTLKVYETPGHTNDCISFFLTQEKIFFPSETMGALSTRGFLFMSILTGYQDTIKSIKKGRQLNADYIISPHYGKVPPNVDYWGLALYTAENYKDFILTRHCQGKSNDEILDEYIKKYWRNVEYNQQPFKAFEINGYYFIRTIINEFGNI